DSPCAGLSEGTGDRIADLSLSEDRFASAPARTDPSLSTADMVAGAGARIDGQRRPTGHGERQRPFDSRFQWPNHQPRDAARHYAAESDGASADAAQRSPGAARRTADRSCGAAS